MEFKKDDIVIVLLTYKLLEGKIGKILSINKDHVLIEFQDWNNGHNGDTGMLHKQNCWWVETHHIEHYKEIDNKSIISLIIE